MTDPRWLDGLRARVQEATATLDSMLVSVHTERQRVLAHLDRITDRVGAGRDARDRALRAQLHERVIGALTSGRLDGLTLREQRYAARQFRHVTPAQMQALLARHPGTWAGFASECLRAFDQLGASPDAAGYRRLLAAAPLRVGVLHQLTRPLELVDPDGPRRVAELLPAGGLGDARAALQARSLDPAWSFTALALTAWLERRVAAGATFDRLWRELAVDLEAEAMLLPRLDGSARSWFSEAARPARIRGAVAASARTVAALLGAAFAPGADPVHVAGFTECLLRSEFRDPRVPPDSHGWREVKQLDAPRYGQFLEQLISEDLEVFFQHAMIDSRRRTFWLRFLRRIRRTVCVLDRATHQRLTRQFAGAEKKLSGAIARARQFTRASGGVNAFCLYFDQIVVVEFSETGNAAYVYERATFERLFGPTLDEYRLTDHTRLKQQAAAIHRFTHKHHDWEADMMNRLQQLGGW